MSKLPKKLKFEQAMQRLEEIVDAMESGEIGIEESIGKYEEAMKLAAHCRDVLDQAEQRIQQIQVDAGGRVQAKPFDAPAPASEDDGAPDA